MATVPEWQILYIDDDQDDIVLLESLCNQFQSHRVVLDWASTYEDGLQKLSTHAYDAALVDYDLGARTGIELIRQSVAPGLDTPIILYTGRGSYAVDLEALQAGATLYVTKSEASALLLERSIRYAIERKQIESELLQSNQQLARELAERKRAEEQARRLNRTLRALGHSSQAVTRLRDEAEFLAEICRIIVEDCGHTLVWIGFAEHDDARSVRVAAYSGFDSSYIDQLNLTWADEPRGRGPSGRALRTGQVEQCRDIPNDPAFAPWREQALARGYASSLALPLLQDGQPFGVLTIYSTEPGGISFDEIGLLNEIAADAAQGVTSIRLRRARALADENLRYLASIPENDPNPITEIALDGTLNYMNAISRALFPDLPACKNAHPWHADWEQLTAAYHSGRATPTTRDVTVGGRIYQQSIIFLPPTEPGSGLIRFYGTDITTRKRAERDLQQSEERFRLALQNMPIIVANFDRDLRYTWFHNPTGGYHVEEVIGQAVGFSAADETGQDSFRRMQVMLETGQPEVWEHSSQTRSGEMTFRTYAEPRFNEAGEIIGGAYISIDITQQKLTDRALQRSEERFSKAFNANPDAMIISRIEDGRILEVNPAFEHLFGYPHDEVLGRSTLDLNFYANPVDRATMIALLRRDGFVSNFILTICSRDGTRRRAALSAVSIDIDGQDHLLTITRDLEPRKRGEAVIVAQVRTE